VPLSNTVVRFVFVGIANTLIGLSLIFVAKGLLGAGDVVANAFGYGVGMLVSFALNRSWTFVHKGPTGRAFVIFLVVQGVAYSLNLVCVLAMIGLGVDSYVSQVLGMPPYIVVSYLGSRYFAFVSARAVDIGARGG